MRILKRRFDEYLPKINATELKYMARLWGGETLTRKAHYIGCIREGLRNPVQVRQVLVRLAPFERDALAWLKRLGGTADPEDLTFVLRASGMPVPVQRSQSFHRKDYHAVCAPLIKQGLLLVDSLRDPITLSNYGHIKVFCDDRLLAAVGEPESRPFFATPRAASQRGLWVSPEHSIFRSPPTVMLDIVGFLQALEDNNGVKLTKSGSVRVADLRKLNRARGWKKEEVVVDGFSFPTPALAFIRALRNVDLITAQGNTLHLKESASDFAQRPISEQVHLLLQGFIQSDNWSEWPGQKGSRINSSGYVQARQALIMGLTALPLEPKGFFNFDQFDQAFFDRMGEYFSLGRLAQRPSSWRHSHDEDRAKATQVWRKNLRENWLKQEKEWTRHALSTWLYFFGMVELGFEGDAITALRLTNLGRAVLHPQLKVSVEPSSAESKSPWIVQPNFELIVYLNHTTAAQLAFLERHAKRISTQQFTAQYQLTRESVYQGLESGTTVDRLLLELQAGASRPLPQNIVIEIREWADLREKMVLRRRASLIEFPTAQAREAALQQQNLIGTPIGERFVLMSAQDAAPPLHNLSRINYTRALPKCLTVDENGRLELLETGADLFIREQLDMWAERTADKQWQLTESTVSAAVQSGLSRQTLLNLLNQRLTHPLPPLLELAVRGWTGNKSSAVMESLTLFTCSPPILEAIIASPKLRPYLHGTLTPEIIVVKSKQVEAFREQLASFGFDVGGELEVKRLPR